MLFLKALIERKKIYISHMFKKIYNTLDCIERILKTQFKEFISIISFFCLFLVLGRSKESNFSILLFFVFSKNSKKRQKNLYPLLLSFVFCLLCWIMVMDEVILVFYSPDVKFWAMQLQ
jgi:hypothetical protein